MSKLTKRWVTGSFLVLCIVSTALIFKARGLSILAYLVALVAIFEYGRLTLKPLSTPRSQRILFAAFAFLFVLITAISPFTQGLPFALGLVVYLSASMWLCHEKMELPSLLSVLSLSVLGFAYCGLLPGLAIRLLFVPNGLEWFGLLLITVSAGDITAYFGGKWWGRKKLMPHVSPKKTVAGSLSGLFGSTVSSCIVASLLIPQLALWQAALLAIVGGSLAQTGDLFASLVKRVVNAKDSGQILPGHGGILDRVDGHLFATPAFLLMAQWVLQGRGL